MADIDGGGDKNFTCVIMKMNCWLILGLMVATGAFAQTATNVPPPTPVPDAQISLPPATSVVTNAPAKKAAPKKHKVLSSTASKKIAFTEPPVMLMPGAAEVAVSNLNVRGQAGLKGEVVSRLNKGDTVTVLTQLNLDKHAAGEPAQWAKIALPASTKIWLNTRFIDSTNKTVLPKKLNLRAGPGENYSVLGVIEHGTTVNEITTKGDWAQIEPPTNSYAFVAAIYLKQEASGTMATNIPASSETEPPAMTNTVPEPMPIVTEPTNPPPAVTDTNVPAPVIPVPVVDTNPPPPRIVSHEGVVGHVDSIIAPTKYILYDPATRQEINFLYTTSTNLDISRYLNMRIIVTGEEGMAKRWDETPLLTIQRIVVIDTNAVPKVYLPTPRQRN
jgi:uncharacterized protein YgiM (DUF1202 family)